MFLIVAVVFVDDVDGDVAVLKAYLGGGGRKSKRAPSWWSSSFPFGLGLVSDFGLSINLVLYPTGISDNGHLANVSSANQIRAFVRKTDRQK